MTLLGKAEANPTKSFFVRMITRDIALEDCILDLVDNSIDGAWSLEGGRPIGLNQAADLSKYEIKIIANEGCFSVSDNCGGMTLKDAEEYAFTFGRKETSEREDFSIGVYGIGMKRAVFKLGENIEITSTWADGSALSAFRVSIDVNQWLSPAKAKEWDFPIYSADPGADSGVNIQVNTLTPETAAAFSSPLFERNLRRILARDYTLHLHYGLRIILNGKAVNGWQIELRESDAFQSMRDAYPDDADGRGEVRVEIVAGMAAPPPDTNDVEEAEGDERYGWYAICNGRVVMAGDKTAAAGWGTEGWPQWHGQYNGFIGLVVFSSVNAALLPLTTTKRSVDVSSGVYRRAQAKMREASKRWTSYTNQRKQAQEEAKIAEAATRPLSIYAIPARAAVALPTYKAVPKEPSGTINYTLPKKRIQALASALGSINMSYREVGLKSFEHTYDDFVGDD
ncbi:ATP-binding protein [Croceibacterium sp. TMG7-5b_MA50]|uniref:ATP-binding protein n=1 Tax=Croceibacterium sp. TMG7-5b_MA50 TaxID=3121290 RepID=UPI003221DC20